MRLENSPLFLPSTIFFENKTCFVSYRVHIKSTTKCQKKKIARKPRYHLMTEVDETLETVFNPHTEAKPQSRKFQVGNNHWWKSCG